MEKCSRLEKADNFGQREEETAGDGMQRTCDFNT